MTLLMCVWLMRRAAQESGQTVVPKVCPERQCSADPQIRVPPHGLCRLEMPEAFRRQRTPQHRTYAAGDIIKFRWEVFPIITRIWHRERACRVTGHNSYICCFMAD